MYIVGLASMAHVYACGRDNHGWNELQIEQKMRVGRMRESKVSDLLSGCQGNYIP